MKLLQIRMDVRSSHTWNHDFFKEKQITCIHKYPDALAIKYFL